MHIYPIATAIQKTIKPNNWKESSTRFIQKQITHHTWWQKYLQKQCIKGR